MGLKKGHLGPEPNFNLLIFGAGKNKKNKKEKNRFPWFGFKQHLKTELVQNLTFKMAKIGPEPSLTAYAYVYICIYIYTHTQADGIANGPCFCGS